jgi:hypothetical protein
MFSQEVVSLLINVVSSWQVIAVTIAIIIYISIISSVARMYYRPRFVSKSPAKRRKKKEKYPDTLSSAAKPGTGDNSNEELGLEEE